MCTYTYCHVLATVSRMGPLPPFVSRDVQRNEQRSEVHTADLAIKCATHSGSTVGRKIRSPAYPRPIPMGFHAFHKPDFPPSQIRLCVAGFMTRFAAFAPIHRSAWKGNSRKFWPSRARSRPTAPHSSGLPTRRPLILRLRTTPAPEELHVVGDDINLASLGAVLGLPGAVL